ncbi:hypothetical protein, partial [Limnospira indica]
EAEDILVNPSSIDDLQGSEEANLIAGSSEDLSGVTVIPTTDDAIALQVEEAEGSSNFDPVDLEEEDVLLADEPSLF